MPPLTLIEDLLWNLSDELAVGACPAPELAALESIALPWWLDHLLRFNWVTNAGQVCKYEIDALKTILRREDLARFLKSSLLPFGTAPNGDPVVFRYSEDSGEVGMVSLEEMGLTDPLEDHYFLVTTTVEEFFLRVVDRLYLPTDSFAAREFSALQASLRRSVGA